MRPPLSGHCYRTSYPTGAARVPTANWKWLNGTHLMDASKIPFHKNAGRHQNWKRTSLLTFLASTHLPWASQDSSKNNNSRCASSRADSIAHPECCHGKSIGWDTKEDVQPNVKENMGWLLLFPTIALNHSGPTVFLYGTEPLQYSVCVRPLPFHPHLKLTSSTKPSANCNETWELAIISIMFRACISVLLDVAATKVQDFQQCPLWVPCCPPKCPPSTQHYQAKCVHLKNG